jgi:hypothetical protein
MSEPSVVAAIVISQEGVLLGRRHDGKPPWTFIAGASKRRLLRRLVDWLT